jgi:hypothetical protein
MPQISFTPKNQTVYDEFSTLMLQYQLAHKCKLTAPEFLKVVLNGYLLYKEIYDLQELDRQVEGLSISQNETE